MNKSMLLGRLTKKPEIRYSQASNVKVANFTLAVNRKYVKTGEERQADFINIVAYSKLADFAEKYLVQGLQICVTGRIQTRKYDDNNGITHYVTEIIAEEIDFADRIKKDNTNENTINESSLINNTQVLNDESSKDFDYSNSDDLPF